MSKHSPVNGALTKRRAMRLVFSAATIFYTLLCATAAKADLIGVTVDGTPLAKGATLPSGAKFAGVVKNPTKDILLLLYVTPPLPPAPPATFRIVRPDGNITVIPNATLFVQPPKQNGDKVEIRYKGESNPIIIKGTLLTPGTPNPAPPDTSVDQSLLGPQGFLTPPEALAGITEIIEQPESSLVLGAPIPLSYFNYDFTGTIDFPVFVGGVTLVDAAGNTNFIGFAPEPSSALLLIGPLIIGFWMKRRGNAHRRSD